MVTIGTPKSATATKVVLCGSGELGKEFVIELQRYGVEVIALDKYPDAPAMQVAHRSYVVSMLDGDALREIIEKEKPDYIVPEVEAIATRTLMELEEEGYHVIPTARATWLTMNREGIRRLAAEELGLPTSPYRFAETEEEFKEAVKVIGMPCVVKPIMSSSGHGQSVVREEKDIDRAWQYAQEGGRAGAGKVIVEGFVDFDYEITQLTVRHIGGTSFLEPVGHVQVDGDYRESWQPQAMSLAAKAKAREIAGKITEALGGRGIFGVELFIKGDDVIFSEVSPRPHDTGMVTMITQDLSQFALHARAVLGACEYTGHGKICHTVNVFFCCKSILDHCLIQMFRKRTEQKNAVDVVVFVYFVDGCKEFFLSHISRKKDLLTCYAKSLAAFCCSSFIRNIAWVFANTNDAECRVYAFAL